MDEIDKTFHFSGFGYPPPINPWAMPKTTWLYSAEQGGREVIGQITLNHWEHPSTGDIYVIKKRMREYLSEQNT